VTAPLDLHGVPIRGLTLDLDDTLWPFAPIAIRVQEALEAFLEEHAPRTAATFDAPARLAAARAIRDAHPDLRHDFASLRTLSLRRMLAECDEDPELAEPAYDVVFAARQQVDLYPDVAPALDRLAARLPLLAVTNGNADLERTGVARWFGGVVAAGDLGTGKPDAEIYRVACERLGLVAAEVLHVGDDLELDVHAALRAGLHAAWVHRDLTGETPPHVLRARNLLELADALGA
jgi:putative hydrolase of the HAD superfamily